MIAQTDNSPAHASLPGAGRLAPPGFDLLLRLAIFMVIAWAFSLYSNTLAGNPDKNIQEGIFWVLVVLAAVWRLRVRRGQAQAGEDALAPGSTCIEQGGQLSRDARAAAAWLDAWRLLWWLAGGLMLVYATQLFMALVLLYATWRGWRGVMDFRHRRIWARAAKRAAAGTAPATGHGQSARAVAWFRPTYWFERFILSWLLLPARLGMFALGLLWRFGVPAIGDAVVLVVLWCLSLLAAGILAG